MRLCDWWRERRITKAMIRMIDAPTLAEKSRHFEKMRRLVHKRSAAQVERMERRMNLK